MPLVDNKYAFGAVAGGMLFLGVGLELQVDLLWQIGFGAAGLGIGILAMNLQMWYCAACGQALGRGDKPSRCDRCGSNRVTTNDPGAKR